MTRVPKHERARMSQSEGGEGDGAGGAGRGKGTKGGADASLEYACKPGATVCYSQAVTIPYLLLQYMSYGLGTRHAHQRPPTSGGAPNAVVSLAVFSAPRESFPKLHT